MTLLHLQEELPTQPYLSLVSFWLRKHNTVSISTSLCMMHVTLPTFGQRSEVD